MQKIATPTSIKYEQGKDPNQGKVMVEAFYPGYAITLGNSLRRILLSSLEGAAIVGVKINGVEHEFATLACLKEDILEFILNLKQIKLKVFTEEVVKLELNVHGKKEIKASDIKGNSLVEIMNPDLVLGSITDMSGSLKAELTVSRGMGYEMIESRESTEKELGYIEMDAIFSPVVSVGLKLDNVRVGKMTNWEKLILNIKTDGTLTPEEAFKNSVAILIDQFNALNPDVSKKKKEEEKAKKEEEKKKEKEKETEEDTEMKPDKETEEKEGAVEEPAPEPVKRKRGRPKKTDK